ncbi:hypothetical protein HanXRQr2_Chr13g0577441 [Helianthus annuus]|uniref:Uncharacterized protein n=1 Tax=Helianthus annuus TaxID=4232 RepID=A0A251SPJ8_HELAN|nr:hypothetical protein HanXRQr2_Chr13g0577441 [Helianthus annuus]KAJ0476097.1 hypothetical protein HanHA300_Chr13g0473301 [Helianthus annuus]KAJ0480161.1 hypothetical protein HanIR_Chr13g0628371 [Helianthus annuus]KAJ0496901.1 hypothetical protein HanHA89_Chr13g0505191 [Helianthus annuus]KAJ0618488.1 hypothetical protein HanHA89_Chr02g0053881 [Helianthus annuus]
MRPIIYIRPLIRMIRSNGKRCFIFGSTKNDGRAMGLAADVQRARATTIHFSTHENPD